MFASETVALDIVGFEFVRDIAAGEAVYVTFDGELYSQQCAESAVLNPLVFLSMFILHAQIQRLMASLFMLRVFTWAKNSDKNCKRMG